MKIRLLAVGTRMPGWIAEGFQEYAKRLPRDTELTLTEIPATPRKGGASGRAGAQEADRMLSRIAANDWVVALDAGAETVTSEALAKRLGQWRMLGRDVVLLVGGADGLGQACFERADQSLSLSALTFPHFLVRVVVAEQIYRAWTMLTGHPYHRA